MPIDDAVQTLITNAPNLVIAIWVIWKGAHLVERLLETQKWMLEQFMALHPPQDEENEKIPAATDSESVKYK